MTTHNYVKQTVFLVVLGVSAAVPTTAADHEKFAGLGGQQRVGGRIEFATMCGCVPPPPPPPPAIASTGVVIANLLPTINAISRDSIISIFGSDFAPSDFSDLDTQVDPATGLVATNQSGVCV